MRRNPLLGLAAALLATGLTGLGSPGAAAAPPPAEPDSTGSADLGGSFTLSGPAARDYRLPADVSELWTARVAGGGTQTRYQQRVDGASVFGGQVTLLRDAAGVTTAVIGAHFPGLKARNARGVSAGQAAARAEERVGSGARTTTYRLDPASGRTFYEVVTQKADHRWLTWVDGGDGSVRKNIDTRAEGTGTGVKGDRKTFSTTRSGSTYLLASQDGRTETRDSGNGGGAGSVMTDADDLWDLGVPKDASPSQPAGVDAHYYGDVVDDFYTATFARNSIDDRGLKIVSSVHYGRNYNNAFWSGAQMVYGDGDGKVFRPLSGGLDVVGHELTHGVTQYTSNLIYENEPGALNEAFSDMMGNTVEFWAQENGRDPSVRPDFLIGEDVYVPADTAAGFRNMTDPAEDGDPDHYSELYTGAEDSGGVHSNSGIPNLVYALAVQGGRNPGCGTSASTHRHQANCDERVAGLGLTAATSIFYRGFTSLPEYANFCDARNATLATAGGRAAKSIGDAWDAVGVQRGCTPGTPPPPPCVSDPAARTPFESPHPYGNNGDCVWTYDNSVGGTGTAGFAFVFERLETEADYDYVYVQDGAGAVLATYTGSYRTPPTSPCIRTPKGSVRLSTDPAVTAYGFRVSGVVAC